MLGAKRYQDKQSKRLSKPKDIEELVQRCNSHLARSLTNLYDSHEMGDRNCLLRSSDSTKRSCTRLEKDNQQMCGTREHKMTKSFYGHNKF